MDNFTFSEDELLSLLKPYQKKILLPLIDSMGEKEAAKIWLSPEVQTQSVAFGGDGNQSDPYFDKLVEEIKKFICGDEKYEESRKDLSDKANATAFSLVSGISALMGDVFGIAPALLMPVVVLILTTISKIGVNAWCATTDLT